MTVTEIPAKRPTGVCQDCGQIHALRADGTLRPHGWRHGQIGNCTGSYRAPVIPRQPEPDAAHLDDPESRWWEHAACRGHDPELFFDTDTRDAKAICRGCKVRDDCLDWSLGGAEHGVWGGLDEDQRRNLRRSRARSTT